MSSNLKQSKAKQHTQTHGPALSHALRIATAPSGRTRGCPVRSCFFTPLSLFLQHLAPPKCAPGAAP